MRKQKLNRKSLDELAEIMPVLSEDEMRLYYGGKAYDVGGTGTIDDPVILQATFNLATYTFGNDSSRIVSAVTSAIDEYNSYGVQKYDGKYYKLEIVVNEVSSSDGHYIYAPGEAGVVGNDRVEDGKIYDSTRLMGTDNLGGSGVVIHYEAIKKMFGSGADYDFVLQRGFVHEIGHSFGLDENQYSIMKSFTQGLGTHPGFLESGAILGIIQNNKGNKK